MPTTAFFDAKPVGLKTNEFPGEPHVAVLLREGFEFVLDFSDYDTLDEVARLFTEARSKLAELQALEAGDVTVDELFPGDVVEHCGRRVVKHVVLNDREATVVFEDGSTKCARDFRFPLLMSEVAR